MCRFVCVRSHPVAAAEHKVRSRFDAFVIDCIIIRVNRI